jgi:hypothetical protein
MEFITTDVNGAGFKQNPGKLSAGEEARLMRIYDNAAHANAIAVLDSRGLRAGWIPRDLADLMSHDIDSGAIKLAECVVEDKRKITVYFERK